MCYQRMGCGLNFSYDAVMALPLDDLTFYVERLGDLRTADVKALLRSK